MTGQRIKDIANIIRLGHIEFLVTDLDRASSFYVELIGLHETARDDRSIYLRCTEDREHHSFILTKSDRPGVGHVSFKVAADSELDAMAARFAELGLKTRWLPEGTEMGQARALRVRDPLGFTIEYYATMEPVDWLLREYHLHRGASPTRVDHANMLVPDAQSGYEWYTDEMGFRCAELTQSEGGDNRIWASWLFRKPTVHDVAVMTGTGPAVHHIGFSLADPISIIKACDAIAGAGYHDAIERGPARHGISNALFVYVRDPDGNRFELYTGDYLTSDPSLEPQVWSLENPVRQTLWGAPPPRRWFEEFMAVRDLEGVEFLEMTEPTVKAVPDYVID